jgi:microcystin-dependent protein
MKYLDNTGLAYFKDKLDTELATKQDSLVSGTNIKTVNNQSLLGSGNINITSGGTWGSITGTLSNQTDLQSVLDSKMPITDITDSTVRVYELDTGLYRIMGTSTDPITVYWKSGGYSFEVNSTEYLLLTINENETVYHFLATRGTYFYEGYVNGPTSGFNKVLSDRDIKDVLTSTDTKSVLSANQGKILNESKQDTLVSGTNIKTINGDSILGSGNISVGGEKVPIGTIFEFPTDDPTKLPTGYLFCDGSAVSRTQYADLFGVIGTTWGAGDGSTTFNLPSKAGLVTVGVDSDDEDFNTIGDTVGEKEHRLTINEIPSHNHVEQYGDSAWVDQNGLGNAATGYKPVYEGKATLKANITTNRGGGYAHNNIQPTVVSNFIIKAANVSQLPDEAEVVDGYSTSTTDAYSANYVNNMILNAVYPVGSIYMSVNSTSPATLFGGTWVAISQGRTLVGVGTGTDINGDSMTWTAEATGGEYLHTLTIDEIPSHHHDVGWDYEGATGSGHGTLLRPQWINPQYQYDASNTGGGQAHNNIQPFFAVYMWKRTA